MYDKLSAEEIQNLQQIEKNLAEVSGQAIKIARSSGLSLPTIAKQMGHTVPIVRQLLKGAAYTSSIEKLARFADACGYQLKIEFVPKNE